METKTIVFLPLTRGKVAVIDFEDFEKVRGMKWRAGAVVHTSYAVRSEPRMVSGKQAKTYLHRFLLDAPSGMFVDHIDGDGLNNRRGNLRLVTHAQNLQNSKKPKGCYSHFKGVSKGDPNWRAQITVGGRKISLGAFLIEEDAARAYDTAATKHFGEFARLNFPDQIQCQSSINAGGAA